MMPDLTVNVEKSFVNCIEPAVTRLGYLYPDYDFDGKENSIIIRSPKAIPKSEISLLKREVKFQLYRERIYKETLPIRNGFYSDG